MRRVLLVVAVTLAMVLPTCAMASNAWFGSNLATITATSNGLTAVYNVDWSKYFATSSFTDITDWTLDDISLVASNGTLLGEITGITISMTPGSSLALDFTALAGNAATKFSIATGFYFDALTNPDGYATATITATDRNRNGASLTGGFEGGKAYSATTNSATFANLIDSPITAPARDSNIERGKYEGAVNSSVDYMSAVYSFELSAKDSASGTSFYELTPTPEPGSFMLLLTGAVGIAGAAIRRRRA